MFAGKAEAPPPRSQHHNKWGGFVFRAYSLAGPGGAGDLVGLTISREEPPALRLMRRTEGFALTRRQTQICVLLALGLSYTSMAQRLGISEHAVNAHGRWIYDKLDVHNRERCSAGLVVQRREVATMQRTAAAVRKRAEARFEMLCCLGLPAEAIMPALLREVHTVIPSHSNAFFWAARRSLSNVYDDPKYDAVDLLYIQVVLSARIRVQPGLTWNEFDVLTFHRTITVEKAAYYKSDLYNLIFRPLGDDDVLILMVRDGGRALGAVQVYRAPGDPPFSAEDKDRLARLEPFVAHALAEPGDLDFPLTEAGDSGLILTNRDGKPLYLSPEARRLLFLANHETIGPGGAQWHAALLPTPVARLCRAPPRGQSGAAAAALPTPQQMGRLRLPRLCTRERPDRHYNQPGKEPLALRLMRLTEGLDLTRRQTEICDLLALGLS